VLVNNAGATWGTAIDDYPDACPLQPRYIMTISLTL
jgi:hypothetical protein